MMKNLKLFLKQMLPVLAVLFLLTIVNFFFLISKTVHAIKTYDWMPAVFMLLITITIPTLLFFLGLRVQYNNLIFFTYKEISFHAKKMFVTYLNNHPKINEKYENVKNLGKDDLNINKILKPWLDKFQNPIFKNITQHLMNRIPLWEFYFASISFAANSRNVTEVANATFQLIDEYIEDHLASNKLTFAMTVLTVINIAFLFYI